MSDPEKRKISARQVLEDIRAGMNDAQLKEKYALSDASLEKVVGKLVAAGHLKRPAPKTAVEPVSAAEPPPAPVPPRVAAVSPPPPPEPEIAPEQAPPQAPVESPHGDLWRCPACNASQPAEVPECPVCGVVVAKFVVRQDQEDHEPFMLSPERPVMSNALIGALCGVVLLAVVGGALYWWTGSGGSGKAAVSGGDSRGKSGKKIGVKAGGTRVAVKETVPEVVTFSDGEPGKIESGKYSELHFSSEGFPLGLSVSQGSSGMHMFETPSPDQGFKNLPPETGVKRFYDQFSIAGQTFLVLTEASAPPKFYLDANKNGNLTDDPGPFLGERPEQVVPNNYTLEIPYPKEKAAAPYRMWLFPSRMGGVRFYPTCYWHGQFEINGRAYTLVLFDANADGDYSNDPAVIAVDEEGKGKETEKLRPGDSCTIDGTTVKLISIPPSGRWVKLEF